MNLKELADLVIVRNHLTTLINDRSQINKDKLKIYSDYRVQLDKVFLNNILHVIPGSYPASGKNAGKLTIQTNDDITMSGKNIEIKDGAIIFNPNKDEQTGSVDIPIVEPIPAVVLNSDQKELEESSTKVAPQNAKKLSTVEVPTTDEDNAVIRASLAKAKKDLAKKKKGGKGAGFTRDTSASED